MRAAVVFLAALLASGASSAEPSLYGRWARGDGVARVRIAPCGTAICAVNTWIRPGVTDEKTGDRLVMNVQPEGARRWNGEAFDPQRDLSYRIAIAVSGKTMTTRGCVLARLLCKSVGWTRLTGD